MKRPDPRQRYPWWVRLTMLGAATRPALLFWAALYVIAAFVSLAVGLWLEEDLAYAALFSALFLIIGVAHWLTAMWLDRHGSWDR
jgi:hypothetical protein